MPIIRFLLNSCRFTWCSSRPNTHDEPFCAYVCIIVPGLVTRYRGCACSLCSHDISSLGIRCYKCPIQRGRFTSHIHSDFVSAATIYTSTLFFLPYPTPDSHKWHGFEVDKMDRHLGNFITSQFKNYVDIPLKCGYFYGDVNRLCTAFRRIPQGTNVASLLFILTICILWVSTVGSFEL